MDRVVFEDIPQDHLLPFTTREMPDGWVLQQEKNPKHVKDCLEDQGVPLMRWPSQSLDLNPMKHLWDELGGRVGSRTHASKQVLLADLKKE